MSNFHEYWNHLAEKNPNLRQEDANTTMTVAEFKRMMSKSWLHGFHASTHVIPPFPEFPKFPEFPEFPKMPPMHSRCDCEFCRHSRGEPANQTSVLSVLAVGLGAGVIAVIIAGLALLLVRRFMGPLP